MNKLDLLLVNAPSRAAVYGELARDFAAIEPPVWAGLIARYCLDRGFLVEILDAEAESLSVLETSIEIMRRQPRLAAFIIYGQQPSASTQCLPAASAVARGVESTIKKLALGTHPSALPERTLREEPFDYVCEGEGPTTVINLLRSLRDGTGFGCGEVPGLWWCGSPAAEPYSNAPATNITDLDAELPGQAWRLLDLTRYRAHNWHLWTASEKEMEMRINNFIATPTGSTRAGGGYASVQTSLGCPFKCTFCCINAPFGGAGIRYWSPVKVVGQIAFLWAHYNITNIKIPDEMFCLNRQHVLGICDGLIELGLGDRLNMWAYARVDTVKDTEMLERMRRAGFRWLGIGVESGSKHVRDGVEKGKFGDDDIRVAIKRVHDAGLCVAANYIFGLPDDTLESMQATLDLACELNTEWANFYCAMAYPGSPLHQMAVEKGWPLPEGPGGPGWIGYAQHAYEAMPLPTYALTSAQVLDFRDEAFMQYFGRESYHELIRAKFGTEARMNIVKMLNYGKPKRKHRGDI